MKSVVIIAIVAVAMIGMMVPNAYATTGEIILDQREFTIHRGNIITFPVIVEVSDYYYHPSLEIIHNGEVIQKIALRSNGDFFHNVIGLNENWSSGYYIINLKYQGMILDSESFIILRDNEIESKIIVYENMSKFNEPFISLSTDKLILEYLSHKIITITGNVADSRFGHLVNVIVEKPDGATEKTRVTVDQDGNFMTFIQIDKHWGSGEYGVSATLFDYKVGPTNFEIQNNWKTPTLEKFVLVEGAMEFFSIQSSGFNILEFSGNVNDQDGIVSILITKPDENIQKFDTNLKPDGTFQFTAVLYDPTTKLPWTVGKYSITANHEKQKFAETTFEIKNDNTIFTQKPTNAIITIFDLDKSASDSIEAFHLESRIVTISGKVDDYVQNTLVTITIVSPDGATNSMLLYCTGDGEYFMPIPIDNTWYSGKYSVYSTYGESVNEVLTFEVTNGVEYISDEAVLESVEITPVLPVLSYSIEKSFSGTELIQFETFVEPVNNLNHVYPIILNPDGTTNILQIKIDSQKKISIQLLIDKNWKSGEYKIMLDEDDPDSIFGYLTITDSEKIYPHLPKKSLTNQDYTNNNYVKILGDKILTSSNSAYVEFKGNIENYSNGLVTITIPEHSEFTTSIYPNSYGDFTKQILLDKKWEKGFHSIVARYDGKVIGTDEFLIAGHDTVYTTPSTSDVHIGIDEIIDSGGVLSVSLNGIIPNFVMSDVKTTEIIMISDDSTQTFTSKPIGLGTFKHLLRITDEFNVGKYDVVCKYDGVEFGSLSVHVDPVNMDWIKDHTKRWLDGNISDVQYVEKLSEMKRGLIIDGDDLSNDSLPDWFGKTAQLWIDGSTDDDSFVDTIQYLVNSGKIW